MAIPDKLVSVNNVATTYQVSRRRNERLTFIFSLQSVTDAANRLDQLAVELAPQVMNMHLQRITFDAFPPAVKRLFKLSAGEHLAGLVDEFTQHHEFTPV